MTQPAKVETSKTGTGRTRADPVARDIACNGGKTPSSRVLATSDALEVCDLLVNGLFLLPPVHVNALVLRASGRSTKGWRIHVRQQEGRDDKKHYVDCTVTRFGFRNNPIPRMTHMDVEAAYEAFCQGISRGTFQNTLRRIL